MRKVSMWVLGLVMVIFDLDGMSTVRKLSKTAIFNRRPGVVGSQSIKMMSPIVKQSVSRTIKEIKKDLKFQEGKGEVFVYNKKTEEGYIFEEKVTNLSPVLNLLLDGNHNRNVEFPVSTSVRSIKTLLSLMQHYSDCLSQKKNEKNESDLFVSCNEDLAKKIKTINSSDLLSAFLLADKLGLTNGNTNVPPGKEKVTDIITVFAEEIKNRLQLNPKDLIIDQGEFELLHFLSHDVIETIFTDTDKNLLLQKIKKRIMQYCFNQTFNNSLNYYQTSDLINKITGIFLNADESRLIYTGFAKVDRPWSDLFLIDMETGKSLYAESKRIYLAPCWIDNNIFAYIQYNENGSNKLLVYNCLLKKFIKEKIIYPDHETEGREDFKILKMLCSNQKIIFLYYCNGNYGVVLFNVFTDTTTYKKISKISQTDPLLIVVKNTISLLAYDKEGLSLYDALIKDDFISDFELLSRESIEFDFASQLNEGVVNRDGSQIAFSRNDNIFLCSLTDFKEKPIKCSGAKNISSFIFSPDNTMLIAPSNEGKIVSFDTTTGEKIGELLFEKNKAFNKNYAVAFSEDGTKFVVSGNNLLNKNHLFSMQLHPDWEKTIKRYLQLLDVTKKYSFDKIIMLKLLSDISDNGKQAVQLNDAEKVIFDQFGNQFSQLLVDVGYVAPKQKLTEPIVNSVYESTIPTKNIWQRVWDSGRYYWNHLNKIILGLPQSG